MSIELNVLFKKVQKDDKKEVLLFHVQGSELPFANELLQMPGKIAIIDVKESEAGEIGAEFVSIQRDDKKTVLKFHIKGGTNNKIELLYGYAGTNVNILLKPSQMTIEEFYEGSEYTVGNDGMVEVAPGQLIIEDVEKPGEEDVH